MLKRIQCVGLMMGWLCTTQIFAADRLVFAADLIRHGDRTPITDLKTPAYTWPEGSGQLTPTGVKQEQKLGAKLRQLYIDRYHLLSTQYQADAISAIATNVPRTQMSAKAFLQGLYPTATIPVAVSTENTLFFGVSQDEEAALLKQYVYSSPAWIQKNQSLLSYYPSWSKLTGLDIEGLNDMISLGDAVYIRNLHHIPLPAGLSHKQMKLIIHTGFWALDYQFQLPQISKPMAKNLLAAIDTDLSNAKQGNAPLKYALFSGHDTNVLNVLSALGVPTAKHVPYASDVQFLLFETPEQAYFVKVSFNGKTLRLPACGKQTLCPLSTFVKIDSN